jgi:hypothetical protein
MKPPEELELSEPRRWRPRVVVVALAADVFAVEGEMLILWVGFLPGERERWEDAATATAAAFDSGLGLVLDWVDVEVLWDAAVGDVDFVVIDRPFEGMVVAVVVVGEELETRDEGDVVEVVALNVGLDRARKAARKFAKKGRLVDMMSGGGEDERWRTGR